LIVQFRQIARSVSDRAVLTAGIISVEPGGTNVVPGTARLTVDFRDLQRANVDRLADTIAAAAQAVATEQGLQVDVEFEPTIPPCRLDDRIQRIIGDAAAARGLVASALPSGAGHDSQNLATLAPTGMIFVPSAGGRSHCPEEHTDWQDVENGANVLLDTLTALADA
jgi:N-carbamoyl-L-amino-acid hydrolase